MKTPVFTVSAIVISVCLALSAAVVAQAPRIVPPDIESALLELTGICSVDAARPKTSAAWDELARSKGMTRDDNAWELTTSAGTLRAFAFFNPEQTSYWLVLFPVASPAIPDSLLSHLLRESTTTEVTGTHVEIGLPTTIDRLLPPEVTVGKFLTVSLTGGRLLSSRTTISWKAQ